MPERELELDVGPARVRLVVPEGASFFELEGLGDGDRYLTWTIEGGFFAVASGGGDDSPDALMEGERARSESFELLSDAPAEVAGEGARRVAFRTTQRLARSNEVRPDGSRVDRDEEVSSRLSDFLFVPRDGAMVSLGYRAEEDSPARATLARVLDRAEVIW